MIVLPVDQARRDYGPLLEAKKAGNEGVFLYLPPGESHTMTLESGKPVYLFVGKGAKLSWDGASPVTSVTVEEGGMFSHVKRGEGIFDVTLKKRARSEVISAVILDEGEVSQHLTAHLVGEEGCASFQSVHRLSEKARSSIGIEVRHIAPNCRSHQHVKAVLADRSRLSFAGKIYVEKEAQRTDAYQLSNVMLLGEHALASTRPGLEIYADDVKASHGSTIGQLSEE